MLDPHFAESLADNKLYQETPMLVDVIDYQQQPLRNSSAFQAFERAHNQGCQMVAIFLHNGKKLAQLLRAADRSHICLVHNYKDIFGFLFTLIGSANLHNILGFIASQQSILALLTSNEIFEVLFFIS
jgi:hypothetical protein